MTNYDGFSSLRLRLQQNTGLEFYGTWEALVGSLGADWEDSGHGESVAELLAEAYGTPLENVSRDNVSAFGGGDDQRVMDWLWNVIYSQDWEGYLFCAGGRTVLTGGLTRSTRTAGGMGGALSQPGGVG